MSKFLTPKQIAQTYVINDIIVHELILGAISEIECWSKQYKVAPTIYEIIHRICELAPRDNLFNVFELNNNDILRIVKNEYMQEINDLALILQKQLADDS